MGKLLDKSPLQAADAPFRARVINHDGLHLGELLRQRLIRVQGRADALASGIEAALGLPLPTTPNRGVPGDACEIAWLGPTRWLIRFAAESEDKAEALMQVTRNGFAADVTHQHVSFSLTGPRAMDFLTRVSSLDLDAPVCGPGFVSRTLFAYLPVLLERRGVEEFRLTVDQSLARYAWDWFTAIVEDVRD